jgi:UPF0755 protein
MNSFLQILKKYIGYFLNIERAASLRWRADVNRRTIFFLLFVASCGLFFYMFVFRAPESFPVNELVAVPEGASVQEIGRELRTQEVVRSPLAFRVLMVVFGRERGARAGDYIFKEPANVWTVARAIASGTFGLEPIRILVPEGATTKQMATIFAGELLRFNSEKFLEQAQPLEGYLFPDTYFFLPNANEEHVLQAMHQNFEEHVATIEKDFASSTRSMSDIIKMASIIEREAHDPEDRRMISGVLWNRIERNMALQVDVTFLYTIGKGTFDLTKKDLATDSPYNTYINKGLPPTPIGSPSMDSIDAALHPTKNNFIYYLADRNGTTYFSKTYDEHLSKKRLYIDT